MPIVYIHGVANREESESYQKGWANTKKFLRRYIAPILHDDHHKVAIENLYWGNLAAQFAWNRSSRPSSPLLGMGVQGDMPVKDQIIAYASNPQYLSYAESSKEPSSSTGLLISAGANEARDEDRSKRSRLGDLSKEELEIYFSTLTQNLILGDDTDVDASIALDQMIYSDQFLKKLKTCHTLKDELVLIEKEFNITYKKIQKEDGNLIAQGAGTFIQKVLDRTNEIFDRVDSSPGFVLSRVLAEVRKPLNDLATLFFGDVAVYLEKRGNSQDPGPIPKKAMAFLNDIQSKKLGPDEPLIVLTHSMGGQIVYDLVTHFIPGSQKYQHLRLDFWCASASQVGLFEELKLFRESKEDYSLDKGNKVPIPNRKFLGDWWNVWDHTDFISFTVRDIFDPEVIDESFNSGLSVAGAHGGYLLRPSFYRKFAGHLEASKKLNWRRS